MRKTGRWLVLLLWMGVRLMQLIQPITNLQEARQRCRSLMDQHGLSAWTLEMTSNLSRIGYCRYEDKTIEVSMFQPNGDPQPILLHEIAHALTPGDKHGFRWKMTCRELGIDPSRTYSYSLAPGLGFKVQCNKCGGTVGTTAGKLRKLSGLRSKCCNSTVRQEKN